MIRERFVGRPKRLLLNSGSSPVYHRPQDDLIWSPDVIKPNAICRVSTRQGLWDQLVCCAAREHAHEADTTCANSLSEFTSARNVAWVASARMQAVQKRFGRLLRLAAWTYDQMDFHDGSCRQATASHNASGEVIPTGSSRLRSPASGSSVIAARWRRESQVEPSSGNACRRQLKAAGMAAWRHNPPRARWKWPWACLLHNSCGSVPAGSSGGSDQAESWLENEKRRDDLL
jgi:hypothetical protein